MPQKTNLAVIVPCYNELANVPHFQREFDAFLALTSAKASEIDFKFFIVNNNSSDGTELELAAFVERNKDRLKLVNCESQGYGAALKFGFKLAQSFDYVGFCDFDNTYPMSSFVDLLKELQRSDLDMVFGARLHADSEIDFTRGFGNRLYVVLLKVLAKSPLNDVCSGMRIFKTRFVGAVTDLTSDDLSFSIQFTAFAVLNKWKLGEVKIPYRSRVGSSKLSVIRDGLKFLAVMLRMTLVGK